jgi:hypothetical protein
MTTDRWVSVEDVAKHLGVARDSVFRWIDGRGLHARKIRRLANLTEVDERVRAGAYAHDGPKTGGDR